MEDEEHVSGSSDFGMLLRRHRLAAGLSQEALAERAGISTNGVSALERGYRRTPQRETLGLLVEASALDGELRDEFEAAAAGPTPRIGSFKVYPRPDVQASTVPLALTSFVAREAELHDITTMLGEHRLVTLTGAGGIGKTRMALRIARASELNADVCFVGLAAVGSSTLVAGAIASALAVSDAPHSPALQSIISYLHDKPLLMVLDNCEHVVAESAAVVDALLRACSNLRILATSREPLRVAGEHAYRLPPLDGPAAAELFVDRARSVDYRFAPDEEALRDIAGICRRLDGIPLAIELAAARVNVLPVRAIHQQLSEHFDLLAGGERTALPRQKAMLATVQWSYDLLTELERRFYQRLSIFSGGCALASASVICMDGEDDGTSPLDVLSSLVDKSLVVAELDGSEARYRLPEPFRLHAREKLALAGQEEKTARCHALYYGELAEWLERAFYSDPEEHWRYLASVELDNWRGALRWALERANDISLGQRLSAALSQVVWLDLAPLEGREYIAQAIAADNDAPPGLLARLYYGDALLAQSFGEDERQLGSAKAAIRLSEAAGDERELARAKSLAAHALIHLGQVGEAQILLRDALPAARALGAVRMTGYILRLLGMASSEQRDGESAREYFREALRTYEQLKGRTGTTGVALDLAEHEFSEGNSELALRLADEALDALRKAGPPRGVLITLSVTVKYLVAMARFDEAMVRAREGLGLARERRVEFFTLYLLHQVAEIIARRSPGESAAGSADRSRAARILGFVDARFAAMGSARDPIAVREYETFLDFLRSSLGAPEVVASMAEGATMAEDEALDLALGL